MSYRLLAYKKVTVNGQTAYCKGEYVRRERAVNNSSAPAWEQVTVSATGEPAVTGRRFVPKTPETFGYDRDGNMTYDGRWEFSWGAENQLLKAESRTNTRQACWRRVEWTYDAKGRRIGQRTWQWTNSTWQVIEALKFVSDPMSVGRHIGELNASNNAVVRSYVWGLALSGSLDGAGGVGGLLWVTMNSSPAAGTHFAAYDGNGNVVGLVSAIIGTETARYEYGPFGEPIRVSGPMAKENPFRFSTKRTDDTSNLVLYEYRLYNPSTARWLSRDPIEELAGPYLYAFCANDAIARIDWLGQNDLAFCGPMMTGEVEWDTPPELAVEISLLMAALLTPVPGDEEIAAAVLTKRLANLLNKCGKCLKSRCRVGWHG